MAERLELLIPERRIRARVAVLARRIEADYRGKRLSLLVVLKGASIFAADLMRQIEIPFTIDFIAAASYGEGIRSSGKVALHGLDTLGLAGRDVLVIEDILDTGRTCAALLDSLRRHGPASVALCTLLRKPAAAALDLPVGYIGFDIPEDFVVGYGMIMPSAIAICATSTGSFSAAIRDDSPVHSSAKGGVASVTKTPAEAGAVLVMGGPEA